MIKFKINLILSKIRGAYTCNKYYERIIIQ